MDSINWFDGTYSERSNKPTINEDCVYITFSRWNSKDYVRFDFSESTILEKIKDGFLFFNFSTVRDGESRIYFDLQEERIDERYYKIKAVDTKAHVKIIIPNGDKICLRPWKGRHQTKFDGKMGLYCIDEEE